MAAALAAVSLMGSAAQREADLAAVQAEIARLEGTLRKSRERSRSLAERLEASEVELALRERRVREAQLAYVVTRWRVLRSEEEVERLERRLEGLRDSLQGHVVTLYSLGRERYLRLLLAMDSDSDLLSGIRQLRFLARRDAIALTEFEEARHALAREGEALALEKGRLASWLAEEEERREEVAAVRARHKTLHAQAERKRRELEARSRSLRERETRLARFIDLLVAEDRSSLRQLPIQEFRGVLDWPLEGRVVTDFGPRLDPRYLTRVPHNGIAIDPGGSREVRPVYPGKVLFAAPFQGYGETVVVRHAGAVLSLYAGLDELEVRKGGVVSLDNILGTVGGELYFELREENRAVDPLDWLR